MPMKRRPQTRTWLSALCAASVASSLASLLVAPGSAGVSPSFDCASFGSRCEADLAEGVEHESTIRVPRGICDEVDDVQVELLLNHSWVGDLRLALRHESSQIEVVLVDRPGSPLPTFYGCPGEDIDAIFDDSADARAEIVCEVTIPAIAGAHQSALYAREIFLEPNSDTFDIEGCPFERFEGEFLPPLNSSDPSDRGCPPFFPSELGEGKFCDFLGRWNDECGDSGLVMRLERDGDSVRANALGLGLPYHFDAEIAGPFEANLTSFGVFGDAEIAGTLELRRTGLSAFQGLPCEGDWTLRIVDEAPPNVGRLGGWVLHLVPAATPTPTFTSTPTHTPTSTPSNTPTETQTPSQTPTDTPSPTATDSPTPTDSPTTAPTDAATPTPTDSPTVAPTDAATATFTDTPTDTPTETPSVTPGGPTLTPTGTSTDTPTETPSITPGGPTLTPTEAAPTSTPGDDACVGDCDGDGSVNIGELIRGVNIALELAALDTCPSFDADNDGTVSIGELIQAVNNALNGC
jgi:subtilisin-like proprotein convertase family protein